MDTLQDSYVNHKVIYLQAYDRTYLAHVLRYDDLVVDIEDVFSKKVTVLIRSAIKEFGYADLTSV